MLVHMTLNVFLRSGPVNSTLQVIYPTCAMLSSSPAQQHVQQFDTTKFKGDAIWKQCAYQMQDDEALGRTHCTLLLRTQAPEECPCPELLPMQVLGTMIWKHTAAT